MEQWLPRGTAITTDKRIKRMISASKDWQIYSTNQDSYVLAVTASIYETWVDKYDLPEGIFAETTANDNCKIFCSSGNYLISSLDKGPYPENNGQVEAFSIAFNTTLKLFPDIDLYDGVYIEEYSLILPGEQNDNAIEKESVYGKWLSGGVNISASSFKRIAQLMSWLPKDSLSKSFELAGIDINEVVEDDLETNDTPIIDVKNNNIDTDEKPSSALPTDKFTLVGRPELEQFFNDNIIDIVLNQEQYRRMGIPFPGATILHGAPGCGKTFAVERLAEYLEWKRFDIDSSTIASSYIHDTSKKISEVFKAAIDASPSILVIDEMEAFLSDRAMSGHSGTHHIEEVAEFLRRIPEAISKGVLVFAMTNMIDKIDPAILRRGRFDHIVEVKMANKDEIATLLKFKFNDLPVVEDVDAEMIATKLDGHPLSDVAFVLREAGRFAVKSNKEFMDQSCFDKALSMLPKKEEKRKIGFNQD